MNNFVARHGDMCIAKMKLNNLNQMNRNQTNKIVLGLGESSGHSHDVLPIGNATIIDVAEKMIDPTSDNAAERNDIYFRVENGAAVITHEEHDPIILPENQEDEVYVRIIQKVTNPFTKRVENVKD